MKKNLAIIQKWNNLEHGSWFSDTEYLFEDRYLSLHIFYSNDDEDSYDYNFEEKEYKFDDIGICQLENLPISFDYYKKIMGHIYFKKIVKIYDKSLNSKLSEQEIRTLKETEKRFESYIENEQASRMIREIKKRI